MLLLKETALIFLVIFCQLLETRLVVRQVSSGKRAATSGDNSALCEEDQKTTSKAVMPTITTTGPDYAASTTSYNVKCGSQEVKLWTFKRMSGYWCMAITYVLGEGDTALPWDATNFNCIINGFKMSSLELDSEWKTFRDYAENLGTIYGVWLAMGFNNATNQYEWTDGRAVPQLRFPQPEVIDRNGKVAWVIDFKATKAPYGKLVVAPDSGINNPPINMGVCGLEGS